jgi:glutamate-1-semialdehyde 2,1-aminomutase
MGKPLASGLPSGAYGMSREVAGRVLAQMEMLGAADVGGVGGTLSGNALSLAAMRATLESVLTDAAYERMIAVARRYSAGVEQVIAESEVPWHIVRLGCRAEYWFCPTPPRNGAEAEAAFDLELTRLMHLYALNRGVLLTPFHNMALMSPATTEADVDLHTRIFGEAVAELLG